METLKSILTDLDNKKISKHQAYTLIMVLFEKDEIIKSSGDFREDSNRETQQEYYGKK